MMMEDDSIPDIETAGGVEVPQRTEAHEKPRRKNVIIITAGVVLVAVITIGVAVGTKKKSDGGSSVDLQEAFLEGLRANDTLFPTVAPPPNPPTDVVPGEECTAGGACSEEGSACRIGTETCCGVTYDSIECECSDEQWMCIYTEACMFPDCEEPTPDPFAPPLPSCDYFASNHFCTGGCTCGKVCLDSVFDDFSVCGCDTTNEQENGCDPNSDKPFCYKAYTTSGVECGCRDDDDCIGGETCDTSWCSANIAPHCSVDHNAECPPSQSPVSSDNVPIPPAVIETLAPTLKATEVVTAPPTPEPTEAVTTPPTPEPTEAATAPPTPEPTEVATTPPTPGSSGSGLEPTLSCVNINFTSSRDYPKDNGFTFRSKETNEVLLTKDEGFMKDSQTEYPFKICDLSAGSYELVVTDVGKDGMTTDGNGQYVVDIDGHVILVGGRFRTYKISHEIAVGFDAKMSETDEAFLLAHNRSRKNFHESQGVSYRPMVWSAELAEGASAWAKKMAKTCDTTPLQSGRFGQNVAGQRLFRPDNAHSPEDIVSWWTNNFNVNAAWSKGTQPGGAVMWRGALYAGCAAEVALIDDCDPETESCYCQISNCRYSRTTNCGVNSATWLDFVLDDNGQLCNAVFCPGADDNGVIVEGACHA